MKQLLNDHSEVTGFEKEMEKLLKKSRTPQDWLDNMLQKSMSRVENNNDNMSAVCVYII